MTTPGTKTYEHVCGYATRSWLVERTEHVNPKKARWCVVEVGSGGGFARLCSADTKREAVSECHERRWRAIALDQARHEGWCIP